ncbi:ECF transporter S component [Clostridium felsineum]|uniref:ECF transporter S component n=1 Tax=Clostridium felsineum TaxID=36839 RepID=UPI00214D4385|nr:ECF transporter S component [Clostridium felsineum]MCR3759578.1 ECF transporter S component [Clostridium felsineum]
MKQNTKNLSRAALLLAIAIVFQFIGKNFPDSQVFVGPAVNAILILSAFVSGTGLGIMVGIFTPLLAFLLGQLNPMLGPFIPFVMIGNALYVLCFGLLKNKGMILSYTGIVIAAVVKFAFLDLSATKIVHALNILPKGQKGQLATKLLAKSMTTPQLITGLIGGIIAVIIISILKRNKVLNNN